MSTYLLNAVHHAGSTFLAVQKQNLETKGTVKSEPTSGHAYPEFAYLVSQDPIVEFDTMDIGTAWGITTSLLGIDIGAAGPVDFYLKKLDTSTGIAAGAVHRRIRLNDGLLIPRQLTVSSREDAVLSYEAIANYDGVNAPFVLNAATALPPSIGDTDRFSIGLCRLGNVVFGGIKSVTVDFGIEVYTDKNSADIWPVECFITQIKPKITIRTTNPEAFDAAGVPLTGLSGTHANTQIFLRARNAAGFIATGSNSHISITMAGVVHVPTVFSAQGHDPGETVLEMVGEYSVAAPNAPLAINTGVVIA